MELLRPFWNKLFSLNWKFGLFLIVLICLPRFGLVLQANVTGHYGAIGLIMVVSALIPFLFLTPAGRTKIGLVKPSDAKWLLFAILLGLGFSLLIHLTGKGLFGTSYENWYQYIGRSYNIPAGISTEDKRVMFIITALVSMIFSPVGEELFFRGIVHSSFRESVGESTASRIDASAFALTHLAHFGLVYVNSQWQILWLPALIWVSSMFIVSLVFYACRKYAGSLLGAIICHAAFNLGMVYCIFYLL
ncbi:MAG: CPBP family intramembrane metalloprotease [Cyclobacteriaceae bacterium]|nr:CPBP family intramembrane metalloprotease [Cyclobacteriaceae bacterium]